MEPTPRGTVVVGTDVKPVQPEGWRIPTFAELVAGLVGAALVVIVIIAVVQALRGADVRPPPAWLIEWTEWAGTIVTIAVAAKVFWEGAKLVSRLKQ
jgi:hypothetical protein